MTAAIQTHTEAAKEEDRAARQGRGEAPRFVLAVNRYAGVPGKGDLTHRLHNDSFVNRRLGWRELLEHVLAFKSFTSPHIKRRVEPGASYRRKVNVKRQQVFFLDFDTGDDRSGLDYLLSLPIVEKHAGLLYESKSHTAKKQRGRVVFATPEPLPAEKADKFLAALKWRFPWADPTPMHRAGVFYGTREDARYELRENWLPLSAVDALIAEHEAAAPEPQIEYEPIDDGPDSPKLRSWVDGIVRKFRETPSQRHRALFKAGAKLGAIYAGLPTYRHLLNGVERQIVAAAKANGYFEKYAGKADEVLRTLRDGWREGMSDPADGLPRFAAPEPPDRDIYSKLLRRIDHTVTLEPGQYLSDVDFDLPRRAFLFSNTGTGKTHWAVYGDHGSRVIVFSTQPALEQTLSDLHNRGRRAGVWYQHKKDVKVDDRLILTTYDSLGAVIEQLSGMVLGARLFVDEVHNLAAASAWHYRGRAMRGLIQLINRYDWRSVTFMSGTPFATTVPELKHFSVIAVDSQVREQRAQVVRYGDRQRLDAFARQLEKEPELKHLILLNNKGDGLMRGLAAAEVAGVSPDVCMTFNADNKHEDDQKHLLKTGRLPAGKRVLFATSVIIESVNIAEDFDRVHVMSHVHPLLLQQLVNRKRGGAVPLCYVYSSGEGDGYRFDTRQEQRRLLSLARKMRDELNELPALDPDSQAAIARRRTRAFFENSLRRLVYEDGGRYEVDHLGVDAETFARHAAYTRRNPKALKGYLARYGWSWAPDIDTTADETVTGLAGQRRILAAELVAQLEARYIGAVKNVREMGLKAMRKVIEDNGKGLGEAAAVTLRIAHYIEKMLWSMGAEGEEQFNEACRLLLELGDSGRKVAAVVRRINAYRYGEQVDVIRSLRDRYAGERMTPEQMRAAIVEEMRGDPFLRVFAQDTWPFAWSEEQEPAVTERQAVRMFGDLFAIKRCKIRQENGERANGYELVDEHPLAESTREAAEAVSLNAVESKDIEPLSETASDEKPETPRRRPVRYAPGHDPDAQRPGEAPRMGLKKLSETAK